MPDLDLTNKSFVICGQKGTGKSWLIKAICDSTPNHLIYDPLGEHEGYRRYTPEDRDSKAELSDMITGIVIPQRPSVFIIDEANKYISPKPAPLPKPGVSDLLDFSRHYSVAWGCGMRRPVQVHSDILELAYCVFAFQTSGKNDFGYYEDLHVGMGDVVRNLPPFHFAVLEAGKHLSIHPPVEMPVHPHYT
jgi:hypothetical protein